MSYEKGGLTTYELVEEIFDNQKSDDQFRFTKDQIHSNIDYFAKQSRYEFDEDELEWNKYDKGGVTGSYWEDKGKYQKEYEKAYKMLVPDTGEADAGLPEALRAISRIGYEYYNNGMINFWDCTTEYDYDYDDEYYEYEECEIDRFYENLIYEVNKEITYEMSRELDDFIKETEGGNFSDKDVIIDRILDHIMEKIKDSGLIDDDNFAKGGVVHSNRFQKWVRGLEKEGYDVAPKVTSQDVTDIINGEPFMRTAITLD